MVMEPVNSSLTSRSLTPGFSVQAEIHHHQPHKPWETSGLRGTRRETSRPGQCQASSSGIPDKFLPSLRIDAHNLALQIIFGKAIDDRAVAVVWCSNDERLIAHTIPFWGRGVLETVVDPGRGLELELSPVKKIYIYICHCRALECAPGYMPRLTHRCLMNVSVKA